MSPFKVTIVSIFFKTMMYPLFYVIQLERLLACCCRRKRFLSQLGGKLLGSSMLLALRENAAAQEALCLLLEWQLVQSDDQRVQIATTLQSTPTGSANYLALCNRQLHLKELVRQSEFMPILT